MRLTHPEDEWTAEAAARVRRHAARLAGGSPARRQERPDHEQDLALRLVRARRQFTPDRGTEAAFATAVLDRAAADLARRRAARKRTPAAPLAHDPVDRRHGPDAGLAFDLVDALDRLSADMRDLADRLRWQTLAAVARDLGVPRSTLQRRVHHLRSALAAFAPTGRACR